MSGNKDNTGKPLPKIQEENWIAYDDIIIPTVLKRLNNSNNNINIENSNEEPGDEALTKGELEELDPEVKLTYEPFIKFIEIDGLRKLFAKHILWKEEGLEIFNKSLKHMMTTGKGNDVHDINTLINLIMKLVHLFLNDHHPQVNIHAMEIFRNLLLQINETKPKLDYDFNITDNVLTKLKQKVGDVNTKVRNKCVQLYSFMLKQNFCDYNNLLSELLETELKHLDNVVQIPKSSKVILGKLAILGDVLEDLPKAIKDKRTEIETFPFNLIANYLFQNVNHAKPEIRKLVRSVIVKLNTNFGFKKLEPFFRKVDERELAKMTSDIPEIQEQLKEKTSALNSSRGRTSARSKSISKEKDGGRSDKKKNSSQSHSPSTSPPQFEKCTHCLKVIDKKIKLSDHVSKDCLMFTNCVKCQTNIEVKLYTNHLLAECPMKSEMKLCKRCKEAIDVKEYEGHVKENKCNPAKILNSSNRCPLCHRDIPPLDKGFQSHLVKDICQKQKRREKVFVK